MATFRSDPPTGVRASRYYGQVLTTLPKTTAVVLKPNVLTLLREDLGSNEAMMAWLADMTRRRGAPIMLHQGDQTLVLGPPGSEERALGHVGVHHEVLEHAFGPIERIESSAA